MGSGFESQGAHFTENPADSSESAGFLRSLNKYSFVVRGAYYPLCFGFRCLEDGIRPRSYRGGVGGYLASPKTTGVRYMFPPRLRRGTRHPDAPLPPCFAAESVRVTP